MTSLRMVTGGLYGTYHDLGHAITMNTPSEMERRDVLRVKLEVLRQEHRDLDDAIRALQDRNSADLFTLQRLKRQKLALKDRIARLEDSLLPDIIA